MLIYFVSGACSLIDEVVWVRLLKLTLGNTVYATSIVVSVFMAGLALGAMIMARYSDRVRMRLRLYALLETLVTISALSLPWLLKVADTVYVWFYQAFHPAHWQLLLVQVIISTGILLVPSMLMGSTLPLLGRFVTSLEKEAGHLVGRLYALNTLGAALGCFLAGFVLIRALGVMGALYVAAVLNLLVAFGGWFMSRFSDVTKEAVPAPSREGRPTKISDGRFYLLVGAFFMSGLISIGYELLWMRSIVHLLGGFTYVFSAVLTVYLLGNVIGAGIGSRLAKRLKTPAVGFAVSLSLLGLYGVFYLPLLISWMANPVRMKKITQAALYCVPASYFIVGPLVHSTILFLLPSIVMGVGFPIALQAWANHMHKVGQSTGTAYAANTAGAVVGGLVTGFVLIPLWGVQSSISALGLAGVWLAGIMSLAFSVSARAVIRWGLMALALFVTILTVKTPANLFSVVVRINPSVPDWQLVAVKEGVTTTVSVHRNTEEGSLQLRSSGQDIAGDSYSARGDQKILGHFGILLNKRAKRVLSVGFGSGETTACLSWHRLEKVDCAEIAPEVVEVSLKFFRHLNLGDRLNQEINMIYMDAKNYIHLTDHTYDVIVNDSIHPRDFAENASLYAKEYFESAKEHLNENGIIMSWLPTYDMPISVFRSIIGTLMEVFPHVTIWYPTVNPAPLVLIVGSEEQQYFSPRHIENELLKDGVGESLSKIAIQNSVDVLSCYIADEEDLRQVVEGFSINSDYRPFVEFTTEGRAPENMILKQFVTNVRADSVYKHIDWAGFGEDQKRKWLESYRRVYEASGYLFRSEGAEKNLEKLQYCLRGLDILPNYEGLVDAKERAERGLYLESVAMIETGHPDKALELALKILEIDSKSATAWMIIVNARQDRGDMEGALTAARRAVELAPDNPEAHFNLGFVLFKLGKFDSAIEEYKQMLRLAEQAGHISHYRRIQMLEALTDVYVAAGRLEEAVATAEKALEFATSAGWQEMIRHMRIRLFSLKADLAAQPQR
jgi:spermidine synthase